VPQATTAERLNQLRADFAIVPQATTAERLNWCLEFVILDTKLQGRDIYL